MKVSIVLFGFAGLISSAVAGDTRLMGESMESDPIDFHGYVLGNPINFIDPLGLEVLVGQHSAFVDSPNNPFNHAAVVLRPDNPSDFANHPLFQHSNGQWATLGGQAFGEGWGLFGRLSSKFNYHGDNPQSLNNLTTVCPLGGQSDTDFIRNLINIAHSYDNSALYDPFPDPWGFTFNSNSYVSGLLNKAGVSPPQLPGSRPGYDRPLPFD